MTQLRRRAQKTTIEVPHIVQAPPGRVRSKVPLIAGGLVLYGFSLYIGYIAYKVYSMPAIDPTNNLHESNVGVYNTIADRYDSLNGMEETLFGIGLLRRWTCRAVAGDVMEVSAGTGRNIPYFNTAKIKSMTFVDQSTEMLEVAKEKWSATKASIPVTFKDQALEGLSPARDQYDTILQTFGLCSIANPTGYLSHLATFARPTGKIILIEHGRSKYAWLNKILDGSVKNHAEKWGCYWNRDITAIVDACEGLEVESVRRWHFGTVYIYHLRPTGK